MSPPTHSIVIPVRHPKVFLREACLSVLAEGLDTDLVIVDDGTMDSLDEIIGDLPVRLFCRHRRTGVAAARNFGADRARGEFLFFLDADDRLVKNGLRWRLDFLEQHPAIGLVAGTFAAAIDDTGAFFANRPFPWAATDVPPLLTKTWARSLPALQTAAWAFGFRRDFFQALGGFDETLQHDPDTDLFLRALDWTDVPFVKRGIVEYRIHGANHTRDQSPDFRQHRRVLAETWLANLAGRSR